MNDDDRRFVREAAAEAAAVAVKAVLDEQTRRASTVTVADGDVRSYASGYASVLIDGDLDPVAQIQVVGPVVAAGDRAKVFFVPGGAVFCMGPIIINDGT